MLTALTLLLHVHQTDTNRLNVQSLTGLFYMLLLAVGIGLCIAAIERIVSACPSIGHQWNRLWRSGTQGFISQVNLTSALDTVHHTVPL